MHHDSRGRMLATLAIYRSGLPHRDGPTRKAVAILLGVSHAQVSHYVTELWRLGLVDVSPWGMRAVTVTADGRDEQIAAKAISWATRTLKGNRNEA